MAKHDPFAPPPPPDPSPQVIEVLSKFEWVDKEDSSIRMRFRKNEASGYYEKKRAGGKTTYETFLFKVRDGKLLLLKFSIARMWGEVELKLRDGTASSGGRIGAKELVLEKDPFAWIIDENDTGELVLRSDAGAGLPG